MLDELPEVVANVAKNNDFNAFVDAIIQLSMFASKGRTEAFLKYPNAELLANDFLYRLSSDLLAKYREQPEHLV